MTEAQSKSARIGIDVGGTKMAIVALDNHGRELANDRTATPGDYEGLLRALRDLALGLEARLGVSATIGIGFPGSPAPQSGLWQNANMTFCNGRALHRDISTVLGRDIRLENDANCFALSEATDGAGSGHRVVFAGTLGSGVGGGLVIDGELHRGPNHLGGEWGHIPLPWPLAEEMPLATCFCGLSGCAEQYISGTGLARDHRAVTGQCLRGEDIVQAYDAGDQAAAATIERFLDRLSRYLAVLVNAIDPDVIVMGGGLGALEDIYRTVPRRIAARSFGGLAWPKLMKPRHGATSGVRGAAWLWPRETVLNAGGTR